MAGLGRDAEPVELVLHVLHEHLHPLRDGPEVVVVKLLTLGRRSAEEGAAGQQQIGPQGGVAGIDQEVLLLSAAAGVHRGDLGFAEQPQQPLGLLVHRGIGAQQRRLLVKRLAGPAHEHGGDAERHAVGGAHQPGGAGDIPGGVAAGLEGGAQTAVREGGAVGLTLHQQLAGELGDRLAVGLGGNKAVVLLGGEVGEGIENVGVIQSAAGAGPVLHRLGHHVGHRGVELAAFADRTLDRAEHPLGERRAHGIEAEDIAGPDLLQGRRRLDRRGRPLENGLEGLEASWGGHGRLRGWGRSFHPSQHKGWCLAMPWSLHKLK